LAAKGFEDATRAAKSPQFDFPGHAYLARALRAEDKSVAGRQEWADAVNAASAQSQSLLLLTQIVSKWGWKSESVDLLWQLAKDMGYTGCCRGWSRSIQEI
jgi:hypothetical protein